MYYCKRLSLKTSNSNLCEDNKNALYVKPSCKGCTDGLIDTDIQVTPSEPPVSRIMCTKCHVNVRSKRGDTPLCSRCLVIEQRKFAKGPKTAMSKERVGNPADLLEILLVKSKPKRKKQIQPRVMPSFGCRNCGNTKIELNKKNWCSPCWSARLKKAKGEKREMRARALRLEPTCKECGKHNKLLNDEGLCPKCNSKLNAIKPEFGRKNQINDKRLIPVEEPKCMRCGKPNNLLNDDGWCPDCINTPFSRKPPVRDNRPLCTKCGKPSGFLDKRNWCLDCVTNFNQTPLNRKPNKSVYINDGSETKTSVNITFGFTSRDARLMRNLLDEIKDNPVHARLCSALLGTIMARATWREEESNDNQ